MSASKNETLALIGTLVITAILVLGGGWWLLQKTNLISAFQSKGGASTPIQDPANPTIAPVPNAPKTFAEVANVPSGLFNYGGSTTWAPVRRDVDFAIQQAIPTFQLRYTEPLAEPPSSGAGIVMVLNNQLSFSQSSRSITSAEQQLAQQRGVSLKEVPVALEGIAIAVNPTLTIPGLTITQVRDIYTGAITNWSQVGGPNLPIVAYSRSADSGTVEFFQSSVLGGAAFATSVQSVGTTTDALRLVADQPGAIYYASAPEIVGQCKVRPLPVGRQAGTWIPPYVEPYVTPENCPGQRNRINSESLRTGQYPLTRRMFVIVRLDGQIDQQAGEAYSQFLLTDQGQNLLAQVGFVRIR